MIDFKRVFFIFVSTFILSSYQIVNSEELRSFNVQIEDCKDFPSDFSLAPEEIYYSLKYAMYQDTFQILEFGAGEGTRRLTELLQNLSIAYEYHSFENAWEYLIDLPNVTYHYYSLPPAPVGSLKEWRPVIQAIEMPDLPIADLVIVDGPHGVSRADWYAKFKYFTRPGTIILIDDFHHFKEFSEELDQNFVYETIIEYYYPHINNGLESIDGIVGKCFKIVRVIDFIK